MTYESRTPSPVPLGARKHRRDKDKSGRDAKAADKLREFLKTSGCDFVVTGACDLRDPSKLELARKGMFLIVRHRGHEFAASYPSMEVMDDLQTKFQAWCKENLRHVRVSSRKN